MDFKVLVIVMLLCVSSLEAQKKSSPRTENRSRPGVGANIKGEKCSCTGDTLECVGSEITSFPRNSRCDNPTTRIVIKHTKIDTLPAGAFSKYNEVQIIVIHSNNLTSLPPHLFTGLRNLKGILILEPHLQSLPNGIFQNLNLIGIILHNNGFDVLPPRLFGNIRTLQSVQMSNSKLTTLPANTFAGIISLKKLYLTNNSLSSIPRGLFSEMRSIEKLQLNGNMLTSITSRDLQGLVNIGFINLESNQLKNMPIFDNSWPKVKKISFVNNTNMIVTEAALRSWLGNGTMPVFVSLYKKGWRGTVVPVSPRVLVPLIKEATVNTEIDEDCKCGSVKLGAAQVSLCVDIVCGHGQRFANWVEAVRATATAGPYTSSSSLNSTRPVKG